MPGTLELATWVRYELRVDVGGQTLLFSDDPAVSASAADAGNPLVRLHVQAAQVDGQGNVDPATAGPWREYVGSQLGSSINRDRGDAFRFDLAIDTSLGVTPVVRELRVFFR